MLGSPTIRCRLECDQLNALHLGAAPDGPQTHDKLRQGKVGRWKVRALLLQSIGVERELLPVECRQLSQPVHSQRKIDEGARFQVLRRPLRKILHQD